MAGGRDYRTIEMDVDVVPMMELPDHLVVGLAIGLREVVLSRVGEDDAEPERGRQGVPLDHRHVVRGIRQLHLDREVQSGRPAAHDDDLHRTPSARAFPESAGTPRACVRIVSAGWRARRPRATPAWPFRTQPRPRSHAAGRAWPTRA